MRFAACALSLVLVLCGCTLAPRVVQPAGPSLDAGQANSGILRALPNHCFLVTPLFSERYAVLASHFGWKLNPPMLAPRWITPTGTNTFVITSDGVAAFAEMSFYERQALTP